jgi:hypothetical protein
MKILLITLISIFFILGCSQNKPLRSQPPITAVYVDLMPCFKDIDLKTVDLDFDEKIADEIISCEIKIFKKVLKEYEYSKDYPVYLRFNDPIYIEYSGTVGELIKEFEEINKTDQKQ